eukprot:6479291-Amphidinium_carterae.1
MLPVRQQAGQQGCSYSSDTGQSRSLSRSSARQVKPQSTDQSHKTVNSELSPYNYYQISGVYSCDKWSQLLVLHKRI